jgi:hypothetical protein
MLSASTMLRAAGSDEGDAQGTRPGKALFSAEVQLELVLRPLNSTHLKDA